MKKLIIFVVVFALIGFGSFALARGGDAQSDGVQNQDQDDQIREIRSEQAREHMSEVAEEVEQLLSTQDTGEIGEQVREIARQQQEDQEELEEDVESIESRPGWVKRIIGPHFAAIRKVEKIMEQNEERIQNLEQLRFQLYDLADRNQIQETIQAMQQQNESLEEITKAEREVGSVFGWLFRVFSR